MWKIKIDQADKAFSLYVRERDEWTCQRCRTRFAPGSAGIHNSHYFGRGRESTRFDPDNCDALCFGCHRFWETQDREGYRRFKIEQLGERRHELLFARSHML